MMRKYLAIAGWLTLATIAPAAAHNPSHPDFVVTPGPEASGCYFSRGEMFCGRYCYWEINGKRYCQSRERDAYPQGAVYVEEQIVPLGSRRRHRYPHYLPRRQTIK